MEKGKMIQGEKIYLGIPPSLQDGQTIYDLPVVETTGFITLSLRDKEKMNKSVKSKPGLDRL